MSKITNDCLISVWQRMLYSSTHMATVSVKGLNGVHNAVGLSVLLMVHETRE